MKKTVLFILFAVFTVNFCSAQSQDCIENVCFELSQDSVKLIFTLKLTAAEVAENNQNLTSSNGESYLQTQLVYTARIVAGGGYEDYFFKRVDIFDAEARTLKIVLKSKGGTIKILTFKIPSPENFPRGL